MREVLAVLAVALASLVVAAIVMRLLLRWLRGRGSGIVDGIARRRWGHIGQECKEEDE